MLRLSAAITTPGTAARHATLDAARDRVAGQANDAYWHGISGLLPATLRRAVKSALLEAERTLDLTLGVPAGARTGEPMRRRRRGADPHARALVTLEPARGGTSPARESARGARLADVLTRRPRRITPSSRPSADHRAGARTITMRRPKESGLAARLAHDPFRRASLLDGLFAAGDRWTRCRVDDGAAPLGGARLSHAPSGSTRHGGTLVPEESGRSLSSRRQRSRGHLRADYRLRRRRRAVGGAVEPGAHRRRRAGPLPHAPERPRWRAVAGGRLAAGPSWTSGSASAPHSRGAPAPSSRGPGRKVSGRNRDSSASIRASPSC